MSHYSKNVSTCLAISTFLMIIVALAVPGNSFVDQKPYRNAGYTYRNSALQVFGFSKSQPISTEEDTDRRSVSMDRRSILFTGASVAAGYFLEKNIPSDNSPAILTTAESSIETGTYAPSKSTVSTVEEALKIIESIGDKRFLHAMVASDYKFFYEGSKTVPSDVDVEDIFSKKVPSIRNESRSVILATTGNLSSKKSSSLWPLGNSVGTGNGDIHYAWPEQGGALQSNKKDDENSTSISNAQSMIVDGIDCGKMSLEDALEGDMQVLVQAPTYLSVPSYMESDLRKGLQEAFFI